jgi:xanthine/CO dehydrogenase XdhC/CoxF family maturation factor
MKEIKAILDAYQKIDFSTAQAALAVVVRVEGSSYRRIGARMLVTSQGHWTGGISGGCLEGDALKRARLAMAQNKASVVTYDTSENDPFQIGVGLGCNGIIDVLLIPLQGQNHQAVSKLAGIQHTRKPEVLLTVVQIKGQNTAYYLGQTFCIADNPIISSQLADQIKQCQDKGKSFTHTLVVEGATISFLIEYLPPSIHLLVHGGNYDIYPMVRLAKEIGWQVSVFCNPLKVQPILFTLADQVLEKETTIPYDTHTAAILMAHDYETDFANLRKYLASTIPYIGLLGPKKRTEKMFTTLLTEGKNLIDSDLSRIFSPAGLDTGASSPEEIAIAILAEIRSVFNNRKGQSLRLRAGAIYEDI